MPIDYSKWDNVGASSDSDEASASHSEDGLTTFGESGGGINRTDFDRDDAPGPCFVPPDASKAERELIRRGVDYEREGNWIRTGVGRKIIVVRLGEPIWIPAWLCGTAYLISATSIPTTTAKATPR